MRRWAVVVLVAALVAAGGWYGLWYRPTRQPSTLDRFIPPAWQETSRTVALPGVCYLFGPECGHIERTYVVPTPAAVAHQQFREQMKKNGWDMIEPRDVTDSYSNSISQKDEWSMYMQIWRGAAKVTFGPPP